MQLRSYSCMCVFVRRIGGGIFSLKITVVMQSNWFTCAVLYAEISDQLSQNKYRRKCLETTNLVHLPILPFYAAQNTTNILRICEKHIVKKMQCKY